METREHARVSIVPFLGAANPHRHASDMTFAGTSALIAGSRHHVTPTVPYAY